MVSRRALLPGLVVLAAAAVAFPGLNARDLTGDELGTLGHTLAEMFDRSVETHRPDQFSAHVPLAWLLRHAIFSLLGDAEPWIWRLHAALGHVAGAVVVHAVARRHRGAGAALAAGLIVALHPVAAYHARDSTNYALDALTGALLLGGLAAVATGRRRAAGLLGAGVLLSCLNDYYAVFVLVPALAITPMLAARAPDPEAARRAARRGWGIPAALLAPGVALGLGRARGTTFEALIARHANEASSWSPAEALESLRWFASSWFDGYEAFSRPTPDLGVIAAAVLAIAVLRGLLRGDAAARAAAVLVVGTAAGMLLVELVFVPWTGREFPVHPRNYLMVLPAAAVLVADLVTAQPRSLRPVVALCILLLLGAASARQAANPTSGRAVAASAIQGAWQPGDRVLTQAPLRLRLAPEQLAATSERWCLEAPPPRRVWLLSFPGGPSAADVGVCAADGEPGPGEALAGHTLRWFEDRALAPHEGPLTNSYLSATRVMLWVEASAPGPVVRLPGPDDPVREPVTALGDPRLLQARRGAAWLLLLGLPAAILRR